MKIYTKTGDKGETSLFGGQRVPKDHLRTEAYGTVDELNSVLGIIRALNYDKQLDKILKALQNDLFIVGADLASPVANEVKPLISKSKNKARSYIPRIRKKNIAALERAIDAIEPKLKPLKSFILPGGSIIASYFHLARTICRRAERAAVSLSRHETLSGDILMYLNRLSDLLFVLARWANQKANVPEAKWKKK